MMFAIFLMTIGAAFVGIAAVLLFAELCVDPRPVDRRAVAWEAAILVVGLLIVFFGYVTPAKSQTHHHPPQHAQLHERFYSTWMRPDNRAISCCNLVDCYPTTVRKVGDVYHARRREDGKWLPVPDRVIEQYQSDARESPDGQTHMCAPPPRSPDLGTIFYLTLGDGT